MWESRWVETGGWVLPFNCGHKLQIHKVHICKFHGKDIYIHYTYNRHREKKVETKEKRKKIEKVFV